jgi:SAM-dependent methyltransferase
MNKLEQWLAHFNTAFESNTLLKITIGNLEVKTSYLRNVFIKPVEIKANIMLSFVYRYQDKDVTKNFNVGEATKTLQELLQKFFFNAELYTQTQIIYFTCAGNNRANQKIIIKANTNAAPVQNLQHDNVKQRLVPTTDLYLKALGITTADGKIKADKQHKYKQINRYVEIIDGILKQETTESNLNIVDMGCGKGYLTFALYQHLAKKVKQLQVKGIELRPNLVDTCNAIATQSQFKQLQFAVGSIDASDIEGCNMLIALHACDTATDDAIAKGIKANAKYIICAPCCHKQIRKQMAPTGALQTLTKHGILLERQAEMVTDAIRALILEAHGYKTQVFEFVDVEDTPKNVMIVAVKKATPANDALAQVAELKSIFGIKEHYLETLL